MSSTITTSGPPPPRSKKGDRSYGIVPIRFIPSHGPPAAATPTASTTQVLLIKQKTLRPEKRPSFWSFPKGHAEPTDESEVHTAARELLEETGLAISLGDILSFPVTPPAKSQGEAIKVEGAAGNGVEFREVYRTPIRNVGKVVRYWPALVKGDQEVKLQDEEIDACRWCTWDEAEGLITYDEGREIVREVKRCLGR